MRPSRLQVYTTCDKKKCTSLLCRTGELDDGGGAIPPIAAGLLPDHGGGAIPGSCGPEDFTRIDTLVDASPLSSVAEGVLAFGDLLQVPCYARALDLKLGLDILRLPGRFRDVLAF